MEARATWARWVVSPVLRLAAVGSLAATLWPHAALAADEGKVPRWQSDRLAVAGGLGGVTDIPLPNLNIGARVIGPLWLETDGGLVKAGSTQNALRSDNEVMAYGGLQATYAVTLSDRFALAPHAGARYLDVLWSEDPRDPIDYSHVVPAFGLRLHYQHSTWFGRLDLSTNPVRYTERDYSTHRTTDSGTDWLYFASLSVGGSWLGD